MYDRAIISRRAALLALWPGRKRLRVAGVEFVRTGRGGASRRYVWIHGNETTAGEVLPQHLQTHAGHGWLVQSKERNVAVAGLRVDPNRWFSTAGARMSLARLNPKATEEERGQALRRIDAERNRLWRALKPPAGGLLIAVHNNAQGYSVKDELGISDRSHLPAAGAPHEFFLASDARDFELLARGPYNAVLQEKPRGEDDGSLSRLAAREGVRYVNLEVGIGKREAQREMLEWLVKTLPERRKGGVR